MFKKFALSGGPGAGKSTARPYLIERLSDCGVTTFMGPEIATIFFSSGIRINDIGDMHFQKKIAEWTLWQEAFFENLAELHSGSTKVLFCDRGLPDGAAYTNGGPREFEKSILQKLNPPMEYIKALARYEALFYLRSPAVDAHLVYERIKQNNPTRLETVAEAKSRDEKTWSAWNGHEHVYLLENVYDNIEIDFTNKLERLGKAVFHALGIPRPIEKEYKFLIDPKTDPRKLANTVPVNIMQTYLVSWDPAVERRVRARRYGEILSTGAVYIYTEKRDYKGAERFENEEVIDAHEAQHLVTTERDNKLKNILKIRWSFAENGLYYQLDSFADQELIILEVELTEEQNDVKIPDGLKVIKDVTHDKRYRNHSIAAGECPGYN